MGTLYSGKPGQHEESECPKRGKLMFWPELDGQHGDAQTLYCPLCGADVQKQRYPEEARIHP